MRVYQDFFIYKSGVYRHSRSAELHDSGYHSVRIIGWGEEESERGPPLKYWVSLYRITQLRNKEEKEEKVQEDYNFSDNFFLHLLNDTAKMSQLLDMLRMSQIVSI